MSNHHSGIHRACAFVMCSRPLSGSRHQESLLKAQRQDREHFRGRKVQKASFDCCLFMTTHSRLLVLLKCLQGGQLSHDAEDSAPRESKTPAPQSAAAASAPKAATAAPAGEPALLFLLLCLLFRPPPQWLAALSKLFA